MDCMISRGWRLKLQFFNRVVTLVTVNGQFFNRLVTLVTVNGAWSCWKALDGAACMHSAPELAINDFNALAPQIQLIGPDLHHFATLRPVFGCVRVSSADRI